MFFGIYQIAVAFESVIYDKGIAILFVISANWMVERKVYAQDNLYFRLFKSVM